MKRDIAPTLLLKTKSKYIISLFSFPIVDLLEGRSYQFFKALPLNLFYYIFVLYYLQVFLSILSLMLNTRFLTTGLELLFLICYNAYGSSVSRNRTVFQLIFVFVDRWTS